MEMDPNSVSAKPNFFSRLPKWSKVLLAVVVLAILAAGAYFVWSWAFVPKDQNGPGQQPTAQTQNKQYKSEKYNFSFSHPAAYEVFESAGEDILGSKESVAFTFTGGEGISGSGSRLTIAVFDWSGDLDSFVSEKIGADSKIKPQECPKKNDCRALAGSVAANFPLLFVFKSAKGIVGIQLKDAEGKLVGQGVGEPLKTALATLFR